MNQQEYMAAAKMALEHRQKFSVSHRVIMADPGDPMGLLVGLPTDQVAEYRGIIQSRDQAISKLLNQVEGQKVSKTGKILAGKTRLDEKTFAMRLVHKHQTLKPLFPTLPNPQASPAEQLQQLKNPALKPGFGDLISGVISQATREDDMPFLRKFFRKPVDTKKLQNGPDPVQEFLVDFWCLQCNGVIIERSDLPPLCFFTDEALTPFCAHALGMDPDQIGDMGKKRRRLGLTQASRPKIRIVVPCNDGILLQEK